MAQESVQPSLLHGFPAPSQPQGKTRIAEDLPVARVLIESGVPHLDRHFDYWVPAELDLTALPGVRVKVRLGGQELNGYLTERLAASDSGANLIPLGKVISPEQVLRPDVLALARTLAERYAGNVSDVLRVAIPPRVVKVEKELADEAAAGGTPGGPAPGPHPPGAHWARYRGGREFLAQLAAGQSPRAVLGSLRGYGPDSWVEELADAVTVTHLSGRGAIVVVPDQRDLDRLTAALTRTIGTAAFARLTAEDGPTPRYRSFLRLLHGDATVAIGTRSAAFAPVADLGLLAIWDDGDELHAELRAPYQHAREVLLHRAGLTGPGHGGPEQGGPAVLLAGLARSTEAERLVATGWAKALEADRSVVRTTVPRVLSTADTFQQERDPLLNMARLPKAAWDAAQAGLTRGPVLVQVARTGFLPTLLCQDCREPARCRHCQGPLAMASDSGVMHCRWCGQLETSWQCQHCGGRRPRAGTVGAERTAEELGRAFPQVPVISSAGDHIKSLVGPNPALVVATPGAEPVAEGGYAAALLLDGNSMLARESLRAAEATLRRWFSAASLVRPAAEQGLVVVTAEQETTVGALVRWDPAGAALRELELRRELFLPPAVRYAALTGSAVGIAGFLEHLDLPPGVRTVGPAPVEPNAFERPRDRSTEKQRLQSIPGTEPSRALLFFGYADAAHVTTALRARKAALSAKRSVDPVNVHVDDIAGL